MVFFISSHISLVLTETERTKIELTADSFFLVYAPFVFSSSFSLPKNVAFAIHNKFFPLYFFLSIECIFPIQLYDGIDCNKFDVEKSQFCLGLEMLFTLTRNHFFSFLQLV